MAFLNVFDQYSFGNTFYSIYLLFVYIMYILFVKDLQIMSFCLLFLLQRQLIYFKMRVYYMFLLTYETTLLLKLEFHSG